MKRSGLLSLGAVSFVATIGAVAACGGDEDADAGTSSSSSGDGGTIRSDATTSSSGGGAACTEAPVDANCNIAKCTAEKGAPAICVAGACQQLDMGDDCKVADIFGASTDDRAIWIGGATALIAAGGKINTSGPPRRNSIQTAVDEINENLGGIPNAEDGCAPRKLAAIVCDDGGGRNTSGTTDVSERIANHLVNDLGIRAVIGAGTSGPTIAMMDKVFSPAGAVLIAPSATAIAITNLASANTPEGDRLLWRTAPSDLLQSKALIELYNGYVAAHPGTTKLAIVDKGDAYGKGLGDEFQASAMLNGQPIPAGNTAGGGDAGADGGGGNPTANFYRGQCTAGAAPADGGGSLCQDQVTALVDLQPTVIVLPGTAESITQIMIPYESTNPGVKPFYLIPDGPAKKELFDYVKSKPEIAARIQGTVPGAVTPLADNFFNFKYKAKFPKVPDENGNPVDSALLFGMAGSYDATYLLSYAMASTNVNAKTFTGSQYSKGLGKTISGINTDVGTANFGAAIEALHAGQGIDFNGASGPLNFDVATGTAPSNMIIWCVRENPNSANGDFQRYDATGQIYNSVTSQLEGTYSCPPVPVP